MCKFFRTEKQTNKQKNKSKSNQNIASANSPEEWFKQKSNATDTNRQEK